MINVDLQQLVQALDAATSYSIESMTLVLSGPNGDLRFSPALPGLA